MGSRSDADDAAGGPARRGEAVRRGQTAVDSPRDDDADGELRLTIEPSAQAPGIARRATREWQSAFGLDERTAEDGLIVVTELVTNAVAHADSPVEVIATMTSGVLRLEVHDLLADPPLVRPLDGSNRGYGLHLVAQLTDRWGWRPSPTGKYVWTETTYATDRTPTDPSTDGRPP